MMLNAWHLPVPPFVKQSKDQLLITLWLTGEDPPQRIMLRTEHDNEEMSVSMHKQRSQQQPGVTAWRAAIDLSTAAIAMICISVYFVEVAEAKK